MTTRKLTRTEAKVLRQASESARGKVAATRADGCGSRAVKAIWSLTASGFLDDIHYYTEWETNRGRTTLYSTTVATITDAGRQAVEVAQVIKWIKLHAGNYKSECGNYEVSKTYARSGWICWDRTVSPVWYSYESTGRKAKDLLEGRALMRARQLDPVKGT